MIGLGKWKTDIDTIFFTGTAVLVIGEKDGKYTMSLELPDGDGDIPEIAVLKAEEDDDTLIAEVTADVMNGKAIDVSLTFKDDVCNGFLKIPFIGKIKIRNAEKVG